DNMNEEKWEQYHIHQNNSWKNLNDHLSPSAPRSINDEWNDIKQVITNSNHLITQHKAPTRRRTINDLKAPPSYHIIKFLIAIRRQIKRNFTSDKFIELWTTYRGKLMKYSEGYNNIKWYFFHHLNDQNHSIKQVNFLLKKYETKYKNEFQKFR